MQVGTAACRTVPPQLATSSCRGWMLLAGFCPTFPWAAPARLRPSAGDCGSGWRTGPTAASGQRCRRHCHPPWTVHGCSAGLLGVCLKTPETYMCSYSKISVKEQTGARRPPVATTSTIPGAHSALVQGDRRTSHKRSPLFGHLASPTTPLANTTSTGPSDTPHAATCTAGGRRQAGQRRQRVCSARGPYSAHKCHAIRRQQRGCSATMCAPAETTTWRTERRCSCWGHGQAACR